MRRAYKILSVMLLFVLALAIVVAQPTKAEADVIYVEERGTYGVLSYAGTNVGAYIMDCDTSVTGTVEIPAQINGYPVVAIDQSAFSGCTGMTGIVIPDSVLVIYDYAFWNCTGLTKITVPDNVEYIGNCVFERCSGLTEITIGDSVQYLGGRAFYECSSLRSVVLPDSVVELGAEIFRNCYNLTTVTLSNSITAIPAGAFKDCVSLPGITAPQSVTAIGDAAFEGCSELTAFVIPDGVTTVGEEAFSGCCALETVTVPDSVTSLGAGAFAFTGLKTVKLGSGITQISDKLFYSCWYMTEVNIPRGVTSIGDTAFYLCTSLKSITIPDTVTSLGYRAISNCTSLTTITIPKSVTSIGGEALASCESVTGIWVDSSNPSYCSDSRGVVYDKNKTVLVQAPGMLTGAYTIPATVTTLRARAFDSCSKMTSVTLPAGITAIPEYAFSCCTGLDTLTIPDGVTTIGTGAFWGCSLKALNLPLSVTCIGGSVLDAGYAAGIYYAGTLAQRNQIEIDSYNYTLEHATWHYAGKSVVITKQPASAVVANGATATVTVGATGEGLTYQWYYAEKGTTTFKLTTSFTGPTYSVTMNSTRNGRQLYCVITDRYGNSVKTNGAYIGMKVSITKQPTSQMVAKGKTVTVSFTASGEGLTYKWYYKDKGALNFTYTPTFTGNTYTTTMTDARAGRQLCCVVSDKNGYGVTTDTVVINIAGTLCITKQPESKQVTNGKTVTVSFTAAGEGLTYRWYYKDKGASTFKLTTTFKGNTYTTQMNSARAGRQIYCVVTDKNGKFVKTNVVTIGMKVSIATQPKSVTVANGKTATVSVSATGEGLTYKWYFKNKGASGFTYTSTFKGSTYTATMNSDRAGRQIYCVITDKYGNTVQTNVVTIGMKVSIATQPKSVTVANGKTATVSVSATGEGLTYKWYFKNKGASGFTYTSTFKGSTYTATMNSDRAGRQIYCVITDKYGNSVKTNVVTLSMA